MYGHCFQLAYDCSVVANSIKGTPAVDHEPTAEFDFDSGQWTSVSSR